MRLDKSAEAIETDNGEDTCVLRYASPRPERPAGDVPEDEESLKHNKAGDWLSPFGGPERALPSLPQAIRVGDLQLAQFLRANGADLRHKGSAPKLFTLACRHGRLDIAQWLFELRCHEGIKDQEHVANLVKILACGEVGLFDWYHEAMRIRVTHPLVLKIAERLCQARHFTAVRHLYDKHRFDPNEPLSASGHTLLMTILLHSNDTAELIPTLEWLRSINCNFNCVSREGCSPLAIAFQRYDAELATWLHGIECTIPPEQSRAVHKCMFDAAGEGRLGILEVMIARFDIPSYVTAPTFRVARAYDTHIEFEQPEPAHVAAYFGHLDVLQFLYAQRRRQLTEGTHTIPERYQWQTLPGAWESFLSGVLRLACVNSQFDVFEWAFGAAAAQGSPGLARTQRLLTALKHAGHAFRGRVLRWMKAQGVPLGGFAAGELCFLKIAAEQGDVPSFEFLMSELACDGKLNCCGGYHLCYAVTGGSLELVKRLLPFEDVVTMCDGTTPLHLACIHRRYSICRFLLENGASYTCVDKYGQRPEFYARQRMDKATVVLIRSIHEARSAPPAKRPKLGEGGCGDSGSDSD